VLEPANSEENPTLATVARTLILDGLAAESISALQTRGIRALLLKGPVTSRWLYAGWRFRDYVDVDVLVAPSDFLRASQTLTELGFRDTQADRSANELVPHANTFVVGGRLLARFPAGLPLDLHCNFHGVQASDGVFWTLAGASAERMRVAGVDVETPSEAMRTLLVALHAATSGPFAVQQLVDLDRTLELLPDETWSAAHDLAMRLDAVPRFVAGLTMRPQGLELVERLGFETRMDVSGALRALGIPPVAEGIERLRTTSGVRGRARLVARELIPTPSFMRAWSPLARRGAVGLGLAYVGRPFWLLRKLPAALRAHRRARQVAKARD